MIILYIVYHTSFILSSIIDRRSSLVTKVGSSKVRGFWLGSDSDPRKVAASTCHLQWQVPINCENVLQFHPVFFWNHSMFSSRGVSIHRPRLAHATSKKPSRTWERLIKSFHMPNWQNSNEKLLDWLLRGTRCSAFPFQTDPQPWRHLAQTCGHPRLSVTTKNGWTYPCIR